MTADARLVELMGALFYFCLKKTGDSYAAEELSQDILENALRSLKSTQPRDFYAWFWSIARARSARFYRTRSQRLSHESELVDDAFADSTEPIDSLLRCEELSFLRRELAFISRDYRELIVGYYLEDLDIKTLATRFSLSCEAVKSRLYRARKILKEGMDMARQFGKRSYRPEEISFVNNGISGELGRPWTVLYHKLYKNIFLEVYGNPESAEQLAIELGIALPYMEDELDFLTRETFLIRKNNCYETAFPIIGREIQRRIHEESLEYAKALTRLLTGAVDRIFEKNPERYGGFVDYSDAKWALLMYAANTALWRSDIRGSNRRTERPNGGKWDIIGYQAVDFDEPPFVGQHGIIDGAGRKCVDFSQFKFNYMSISSRTPSCLSYDDGEALLAIVRGEPCDEHFASRLIEYGYARREGERLVPMFCVVKELPELTELTEAGRLLGQANRRFSELIAAELPETIRSDEIQRSLACSQTVERGYIVNEALELGWLTVSETRALGAIMVV